MGDYFSITDDDDMGALSGPSLVGGAAQHHHVPLASVVLAQPSGGAAEVVEISQLLQQFEAAGPHPGGVHMHPQQPQQPVVPANTSVFQAAAMQQQQQAAASGLPPRPQQQLPPPVTIQRQAVPAVQVVPAPPPRQPALHQQLPLVPSMSSAAGGSGMAGFPAGHLVQPSASAAAAPGIPPKDAAAAARAARQRKRKEMMAAAAEKAAAAASQEAFAALQQGFGGSMVPLQPGALDMQGLPLLMATPLLPPAPAAAAAAAAALPLEAEEASYGEAEGGDDEKAQRRMIKNRESAARSRARRQEYTASLEQQVAQLREQNKDLRVQVVLAAQAPADPHAGKLDGQLLRRTRTTPL